MSQVKKTKLGHRNFVISMFVARCPKCPIYFDILLGVNIYFKRRGANKNVKHTIIRCAYSHGIPRGNKPVNGKDTIPRDRIRIKDISLEGFNEQYGKNNKRDNKIRIIMDNHPHWEKSNKKRNSIWKSKRHRI